jgi:guanosine-3',5'-bis(diphosphate) 3'-pyrophosphohydrolase
MENRMEKAIKLVFIAHKGQMRRNANIEFSYHPISVGMMLQAYGCNEDIIITGLLHDLIEDTKYDYNYIKEHFTETIANNVLALSEDKTISDFKKRKETFINNLYNLNDDLIIVELFDKMHNLISDYELHQEIGSQIYNNNYDDIKWYYLEMLKLFKIKIKDQKLISRYLELVNHYFK